MASIGFGPASRQDGSGASMPSLADAIASSRCLSFSSGCQLCGSARRAPVTAWRCLSRSTSIQLDASAARGCPASSCAARCSGSSHVLRLCRITSTNASRASPAAFRTARMASVGFVCASRPHSSPIVDASARRLISARCRRGRCQYRGACPDLVSAFVPGRNRPASVSTLPSGWPPVSSRKPTIRPRWLVNQSTKRTTT